ncbi:MAG: ABC transporter permease, partial [Haloarculaceae archaeon]
DYLTVLTRFIIRPLVFFGGVFYALDALPSFWRGVSLLNPMIYMVNGVRYGVLGITEVEQNFSLLVLTGLSLVVIGIDVVLFRRGYGLME